MKSGMELLLEMANCPLRSENSAYIWGLLYAWMLFLEQSPGGRKVSCPAQVSTVCSPRCPLCPALTDTEAKLG